MKNENGVKKWEGDSLLDEGFVRRVQWLDEATGKVTNLHPFGQDLYDQLWTDEMLAILDDAGWLDGGCLILASALRTWSGGELEPIVWAFPDPSRPGEVVASHYAMGLYVNGGDTLVVLDGNGLGTRDDFMASMSFEHANHPPECQGRLLQGKQAMSLFEAACEGQRPEEEANLYPSDFRPLQVRQMLQERLGLFSIDRILMCWPLEGDDSFVQQEKSLASHLTFSYVPLSEAGRKRR